MAKIKQQYGQYMTPKVIANFMVTLIEHNKSSSVLEPSCGTGIFIDELQYYGFNNISAYEIDDGILGKRKNVNIGSFVTSPIDEKFDVIIGNPPYIRWKNLENELKNELKQCDLWNRHCNS